MIIAKMRTFFIPYIPVSVERTACRDVNIPKPLVLAPRWDENKHSLVYTYPRDIFTGILSCLSVCSCSLFASRPMPIAAREEYKKTENFLKVFTGNRG